MGIKKLENERQVLRIDLWMNRQLLRVERQDLLVDKRILRALQVVRQVLRMTRGVLLILQVA